MSVDYRIMWSASVRVVFSVYIALQFCNTTLANYVLEREREGMGTNWLFVHYSFSTAIGSRRVVSPRLL